jgi:hypothetical protein
MKNPLCAIYVIVLSTLLSSCGQDAPPLSCAEWTPECEMQKEYIYFMVDSIPTEGYQPIDGLGLPLEEQTYYIMSRKTNAPIKTHHPGQNNLIYTGLSARSIRYTTELLGLDSRIVRVRLYLFGKDEVRPSIGVTVQSLVTPH